MKQPYKKKEIHGKRITFQQKEVVTIEDFTLRPPEPNEVLIKTISTLISPGTETAFLMALPNTSGVFPQYPGYSNAGVILSVGDKISQLKIGDRVVSREPHASHVLASEETVLKIPDETTFDEASFFALGSIALQGIRKADIELGDSAVVLGQGLVGNLALQLARLSGGMPVIGVDLYENRLKTSSKCGADYVFNPSIVDLEKEVRKITDDKSVNVVIEATGNPDLIATAPKLLSDYGRVIILGSPRGETKINFYREIHRKGISIVGAHESTRPKYESCHGWWTQKDDTSLILKLIGKGLLKVKDLITQKLDFRDANEAYKKLIESKENVLSIILNWEA